MNYFPKGSLARRVIKAQSFDVDKLKKKLLEIIKGDEPEEDWDEEYGRLENKLEELKTEEAILKFGAEHTAYSLNELRDLLSGEVK